MTRAQAARQLVAAGHVVVFARPARWPLLLVAAAAAAFAWGIR